MLSGPLILEKINKSNDKESKNLASADFFCLTKINNMYAVEIVFFRNGRNFGSNTHYPYVYKEEDNKSLLDKVFPNINIKGDIGKNKTLLSNEKAKNILGFKIL